MKLWEILPQLKEGQTFKVTFKDGAKDSDIVYRHGCLRYADDGKAIALYEFMLEADFELIPQFIPFEEALAELRRGNTVMCEYDKKLPNDSYWSGQIEVTEITPIQAKQNFALTFDIMLNGKWWVK